MTRPLYSFFFCSGISGLIYQVVWVRVLGNVFGNTVYSASLVVAVFMLGLGVGSYVVGGWADRRYAELRPSPDAPLSRKGLPAADRWNPRFGPRGDPLLRTYGYVELVIGLLGLTTSALLPHLVHVSELVSSYSLDASGWHVLSATSYLARGGILIVLLTPITLLMGGTLTVLIRYLVQKDLAIGGRRIATIYGVNAGGAAVGCFLTDFALIPAYGLWGAQMIGVGFNLMAAAGALWLARPSTRPSHGRAMSLATAIPPARRVPRRALGKRQLTAPLDSGGGTLSIPAPASSAVILTAGALAMSGFAAMGMEILWFRHFTILLGGYREVFSVLLTTILAGIGGGALVAGHLYRRTTRPAQWFMVVQGLFVAWSLLGLANTIRASAEMGTALRIDAEWARTVAELWFNIRPMLLEVLPPAVLMGFTFPLANAIIQRSEDSVGRGAGVLYLFNTAGAVCGSLAAGFLLLPALGIQGSAPILAIIAGLAGVLIHLAAVAARRASATLARDPASPGSGKFFGASAPGSFTLRVERAALVGSALIGGVALGLWLRLPSDHVITRATSRPEKNERVLFLREGLTEVVAVTEVPDGRRLLTNGHAMSATTPAAQRYMRALVHVPLLSIDGPEAVLVIGFGVGNTAHAATLYPSIRRVDVAELSRDILISAGYFGEVNRDVLKDPRVNVYVNDGRHHLQMQPEGSYDLITLEPPPIAFAGVAALYSREFYTLARTRLRPKGYISQWLPAYQVPAATTLAMVRAFVEVFPRAVLVSGALGELLLLGANDSRIEIDPGRVAAVVSSAPEVREDLQRLDLGRPYEIVGMFVGSAETLAEATRDSAPVTDDRPIQEYSVRSRLEPAAAVPASLSDQGQIGAWCPKCFVDGKPASLVEGLDTYLALLQLAYAAPADVNRVGILARLGNRAVAGSAYLGAVVPESADLHNVLGAGLADKGRFDEAIVEFRQALRLAPRSAATHRQLGAALVSSGVETEAFDHLERSVELDPTNGRARYDVATILLDSGHYARAAEEFRTTLRLIPDSVEARNSLGVALASQGKVDEAIDQFRQAVTMRPEYADAQRNLTVLLRQRSPGARDGDHSR